MNSDFDWDKGKVIKLPTNNNAKINSISKDDFDWDKGIPVNSLSIATQQPITQQTIAQQSTPNAFNKTLDFLGNLTGAKEGAELLTPLLIYPYTSKLNRELQSQTKETEDALQKAIIQAKAKGDQDAVNRLTQALQSSKEFFSTHSNPVHVTTENLPTSKQAFGGGLKMATTLLGAFPELTGLSSIAKSIQGAGLGSALSRVGLAAGSSALSGGLYGAGQAMSQNKNIKDVAKEAIKQGLLSGAIGGALQGVTEAGTGIAKTLGRNIETNVLHPTLTDKTHGFKIENVDKYGLGGSVEETYEKATDKLSDLSNQLQQILNESSVKGAKVNIDDVIRRTEEQIAPKVATAGKAPEAFNMNKYWEQLKQDIYDWLGPNYPTYHESVPPPGQLLSLGENGLQEGDKVADLVLANELKQAVAPYTDFSFLHGKVDAPTSAATVYNIFYHNLQKAIEDAAKDPAVHDLNHQMSEIIPIKIAAWKKLNAATPLLGLKETMGLLSAALSSSTHKAATALGITLANMLTKSGKVGNWLSNRPTPNVISPIVGTMGSALINQSTEPTPQQLQDYQKQLETLQKLLGQTY
jgi:hypothetical protein